MTRTYARVYHDIVDDPMFQRVFDNNDALAQWLRMLLVADAMHPVSVAMPRRNPAVRLLIDVGLVLERPGNRYTIRGLDAERERRSASARNAAAVRWQSGRNADAMPSKAKQSIEEQSSPANASNGTGSFMGFRQKADPVDVQRQADEAWTKCEECGVVGRKHSAAGEHQFRPEKLRSVK